MKLLAIDEFGEILKNYNSIAIEVLREVIKNSVAKNQKCLSFIDLSGDTYFNSYQLIILKAEIDQLGNIDSSLKTKLEEAIKFCISENILLKFKC